MLVHPLTRRCAQLLSAAINRLFYRMSGLAARKGNIAHWLSAYMVAKKELARAWRERLEKRQHNVPKRMSEHRAIQIVRMLRCVPGACFAVPLFNLRPIEHVTAAAILAVSPNWRRVSVMSFSFCALQFKVRTICATSRLGSRFASNAWYDTSVFRCQTGDTTVS